MKLCRHLMIQLVLAASILCGCSPNPKIDLTAILQSKRNAEITVSWLNIDLDAGGELPSLIEQKKYEHKLSDQNAECVISAVKQAQPKNERWNHPILHKRVVYSISVENECWLILMEFLEDRDSPNRWVALTVIAHNNSRQDQPTYKIAGELANKLFKMLEIVPVRSR